MFIKIESPHGGTSYLNVDRVLQVDMEAESVVIHFGDGEPTFFTTPQEIEQVRTAFDALLPSTPAVTDKASAPRPAEASVVARETGIIEMQRGETKNSCSPLWRCKTDDGLTVNIFQHADPLKDNYRLFQDAGYWRWMDEMRVGDKLTWHDHPVGVEVIPDGSFWRIVAVLTRGHVTHPDSPPPVPEAAPDLPAPDIIDGNAATPESDVLAALKALDLDGD